jgi:hypothetical protein
MSTITRRTLLTVGASMVVGVAGCLGVSDDGTTGTQGEKTDTATGTQGEKTDTATRTAPASLSIEHVRLCAEEPTGYREYVQQPDTTYDPGDVVWVYLEPSSVGTESAGSGERRFSYDVTWTVFGPDGAPVETLSETIEREVPESSDLSELFLTLSFSPPTAFEAGEHRIQIELTDTITGAETVESVRFDVTDADGQTGSRAFALDHFRFLDSEPSGYREYSALEEATYGPDERIWLYVEPVGVTFERVDGGRWYELDVSVTITGPDGETSLPVKETVRRQLPESRDPETLYLAVDFAAPRPTTGEYTAEISVRDVLAVEGTSMETTFTVEDPAQQYLSAFREVITAETEIVVDRLRLNDAVLRLWYRTPNTYGEAAFDGEVGFVAGAYAGLLEEGLSATRLRVSGTDGDGQEFVYEVDSERARAWNDGESTRDEYLDHVFDTLERRDSAETSSV